MYSGASHTWSWTCDGTNGASSDSCGASELYCGDTAVNGAESCDDGADGDANDGCNDSCEDTIT